MPVSLSRRLTLLVVILVALFYFQCSSSRRMRGCPDPDPQKYKPQIAVVQLPDGTLGAEPRVAVVWDVEPTQRKATAEDAGSQATEFYDRERSQKPVTITWTAPAGMNDMYVQFEGQNGESLCVTKPKCANGKCTATVKPLGEDPHGKKASRRCTYKMFAGPHTDEDADIVVTVCCW